MNKNHILLSMTLVHLEDKDRRLLFQKPSIPLYSCDPASICSTYILGSKTLVGPLDEATSWSSLAAFKLLSQSFAVPPVSRVYDDHLDVYYLSHPTLTYLNSPDYLSFEAEERLLTFVRDLPYRPLLPLSRLVCISVFDGQPHLTLRPSPWISRKIHG